MILLFGGTTEGRIAAHVLDEAGSPFFYSTRGDGQIVELTHGTHITGALDEKGMEDFCRANEIKLIIDAAHPFAELLHRTVAHVAQNLGVDVVRYERQYPDLSDDKSIVWCRDFGDAVCKIKESGVVSLLALTGVQTIGKMRELWNGDIKCWFRILDRDTSRDIAEKEGISSAQLVYYHENEDERELMRQLAPEAIVTKESGVSGGFVEKVEAAKELGVRVFVVRRPSLPSFFKTVNGPHGLRRKVEKLLPTFFSLHSGLTTGTCATAASCASTLFFLKHKEADTVNVTLPNDETIDVAIHFIDPKNGRATVLKDAGSDPDVTNGTAVCAEVKYFAGEETEIEVVGGEGVGVVTMPGLGLPIGSAAINRAPREMIKRNVLRVLKLYDADCGKYVITISVPEGRQLALRTFNGRLGVEGGISIIGTSGIVLPFSSEAFVRSIRKYLEVAVASGSQIVVLNSGAKSEAFLHKRFPDLPLQAFVHYGNFIGETISIANELNIKNIVLGIMIGKAVKLAEGNLNTHSKYNELNKTFLHSVAQSIAATAKTHETIDKITLARQLQELLPPEELRPFAHKILLLCHEHCAPLLPNGNIKILLVCEDGAILE